MSLSQLNIQIATSQFALISNEKLSAYLKAFQSLASAYPSDTWIPIALKLHFAIFTQEHIDPVIAYEELLQVAPILKEEFEYRLTNQNGKKL